MFTFLYLMLFCQSTKGEKIQIENHSKKQRFTIISCVAVHFVPHFVPHSTFVFYPDGKKHPVKNNIGTILFSDVKHDKEERRTQQIITSKWCHVYTQSGFAKFYFAMNEKWFLAYKI